MRHAVIMAGGAGTRLWPLSRRQRPKQLLRLFDGASLLQLARRRIAPLFAAENTWVITAAGYLDQVAAELPDLPRANLIGEPLMRDTANAIGLAANLIARRDPDATMAVFTADHLITPDAPFAAAIARGLAAAEAFPESLVTFGITPTHPETGYGYVQRGDAVAEQVFAVRAFREKPELVTAEQYLAAGDCYWNSGMFAWRVGAILAELGANLPQNAATLGALAADWERVAPNELAERFQTLKRISIDFAVMEHARRVLVTPMEVLWRDVGSWTALAAALPADDAGNVVVAPRVLSADSIGCTCISEDDHLLVLLGMRDVVVVRSSDATLVCHRDQAQRVKEITERLAERFGDEYA